MNLSMKQKQKQNHIIEIKLVVAKGEGIEEGWSGRLGLADRSYYI